MAVLSEPDNDRPPGGRLRKVLITAILVAVAAGSVALAVYVVLNLPGRSDPRGSHKLHFKCGNPKCGYEFDVEPRKYSAWAAEAKPSADNLGKANCPKCGTQFSGVLMGQCPTCKKYFQREDAKRAAVEKNSRAPEICPHCGGDLHVAPRARER